jgi:hypothetical protein
MNLNDLYEGREPYQQAIDKLEQRRIEDLNAKMDDLARRAKEATDPKAVTALRHEFAKAKAERDSYHQVNVEEHGGGGGGPAQWHAYVKAHRTNESAEDYKAIIRKVMDRVFVDGGGGNLSYIITQRAPTLDALRDIYHDDIEAMLAKAHPNELKKAADELSAMLTKQVDEHGGGVNGMKNYISWRKKANTERGVTKSAPPVGKSAPSSLPTIPKGTVHGKLDQSKGVVPKAAFGEGYVADTNYKYIVMVNGEEEGEYSSAEEAKDVVRTMRTRGPSNNFSIKRKPLTSTRSINKFQRSHSIDEGWQDFNKVEPYAVCLAGKPVKKFDYYEEARRFHDNWKQKLYREGDMAKAEKITLMPLNLDEAGMDWAAHKPTGPKFSGYLKGTDPAPTEFGNKSVGGCEESVEVSEGGDRVDPILIKALNNMPDGLASHGEVLNACYDAYAMELGKMEMKSQYGTTRAYIPQLMDLYKEKHGLTFSEAANPAQQAAIAVNMKKHHQKPKTEGAKVDRMQKHIAKSEKDLGHSKKDAEAIGWATLNKRGYLDNINKKEHTEEGIEGNMTVRSMPLMQPLKKRNPVAKNAIQSGAGKHANNLKKAVAQGRKAKHKAQAIPFDESAQPNFLSWVMEQAEFAGFDKNPAIYESARQAFAEAKISEIKKGQKDSNGNTGCWDGYHAAGTKKGKNGGQVRNCVPNESIEEDTVQIPHKGKMVTGKVVRKDPVSGEYIVDVGEYGSVRVPAHKVKHGVEEDWQKANKKDKTDGMSQKAVNSYKREHPGSKLKTAVTTKPSKLKKGSKASKRRSSYCARSKGQMKMHSISCAKTPDKAICKSRRRWNCESIETLDAMLAEAVKKRDELEQGQYYIWTVYFDDGNNKRVKVTSDKFDAKAYYSKKNKVVVNVDYDWTIHNDRA